MWAITCLRTTFGTAATAVPRTAPVRGMDEVEFDLQSAAASLGMLDVARRQVVVAASAPGLDGTQSPDASAFNFYGD